MASGTEPCASICSAAARPPADRTGVHHDDPGGTRIPFSSSAANAAICPSCVLRVDAKSRPATTASRRRPVSARCSSDEPTALAGRRRSRTRGRPPRRDTRANLMPCARTIVQKPVVEMGVAEDHAVDAAMRASSRVRATWFVVDVERVGDEGRESVLGGGLLDALVDRRQHEVLQPRDQHTDQSGPVECAGRGLRVGGVVVLLRERADGRRCRAAAQRARRRPRNVAVRGTPSTRSRPASSAIIRSVIGPAVTPSANCPPIVATTSTRHCARSSITASVWRKLHKRLRQTFVSCLTRLVRHPNQASKVDGHNDPARCRPDDPRRGDRDRRHDRRHRTDAGGALLASTVPIACSVVRRRHRSRWNPRPHDASVPTA